MLDQQNLAFGELGLSGTMLNALHKKGYEKPTPIQQTVIPILLNKSDDLVVQSQTGTGKTAAFGVPMLENMKSGSKAIKGLVLTPTRELALQVADEIASLAGARKVRVLTVYGGQSISLQLEQLRRGVDLVVGTPGRVLDLLSRGKLDLSGIQYAVLDEADEMLNMGFIEDVEKILEYCPEERQTLLFSATMPQAILRVAKKYMRKFETIRTQSSQKTTDLTRQTYIDVLPNQKFEVLCRLVQMESDFYGLVFCRTKAEVDAVAGKLITRGFNAEGLHGDLSQYQREKILLKFREQQVRILVATDVAARGIDVQHLTHVINYDLPQDVDAYVHRVGRTGRAGNHGAAVSLVLPSERRKLQAIRKATRADIRSMQIPAAREIIQAKREQIRNQFAEKLESEIPPQYYLLAEELLRENPPEELLAAALHLAFQNDLDPAFYPELSRKKAPRRGRDVRLRVARGRKHARDKRNLVEFIMRKTGLDNRQINAVEMQKNHSFITIPGFEIERVLSSNHSHSEPIPLFEVVEPRREKKRKRSA